MLYVVLLVCSVAQPVCDEKHARAFKAFRAPSGSAVYCLPPNLTPDDGAAIATGPGEYLAWKCKTEIETVKPLSAPTP